MNVLSVIFFSGFAPNKHEMAQNRELKPDSLFPTTVEPRDNEFQGINKSELL